MENFMNEYIAEKSKDVVEEKDTITMEDVGMVEATPFVPEDDLIANTLKSINSNSVSEELKGAIGEQIQESSYLLKHGIDDNKILIQGLRSSVVSLKVSTSRIEKDVKDLAVTVAKFSNDKKQLENSLIDIEFQFNELVMRQEESDHNYRQQTTLPNDDMEIRIKHIMESLDNKIKHLYSKIALIDNQNPRIISLSDNIKKGEIILKDVQQTLVYQQKELVKFDDMQNLKVMKHEQVCDNNLLQARVNEFIAKTEFNEKSIATAWVGLIAALLLIPIAFFLGKLL